MTEEECGAHDRRVWAAKARRKAGPAVELARLLLESAGLDPAYAPPLLDAAESAEDVLQALRAHVRVEPRYSSSDVDRAWPEPAAGEPVPHPVEFGPGSGKAMSLEVLVMRKSRARTTRSPCCSIRPSTTTGRSGRSRQCDAARGQQRHPDTREGSTWGARRAWRDGFRFSKCGISTVDLVPLATLQRALISVLDRERGSALMDAMDACNRRWGGGAVVPVNAGLVERRTWSTKFEMRSPR